MLGSNFFTRAVLTLYLVSTVLGIGIGERAGRAIPIPQQPAPAAQKPASYTPSEVQSLRLTVRNRDTQLSQRNLQDAQIAFRRALDLYTGEAEKIRQENKWPDTVKFDPVTMAFSEPPAPPKKEEPKKP